MACLKHIRHNGPSFFLFETRQKHQKYSFSIFSKRKITNKRTLLFHLQYKFDLVRNKCLNNENIKEIVFTYILKNIQKFVDRFYYTIVYFYSEYFIFTIIDNSCSLFEHQKSHIPMFTAKRVSYERGRINIIY